MTLKPCIPKPCIPKPCIPKPSILKPCILALMLVVLLPATARAELIVVVRAGSPVTTLGPEQVARIFLGKQLRLPTGETAIPVDQASGPVRDTFYQKLTGKNRALINAYWAQRLFTGRGKPPPQLASAAEVIDFVTRTPNAIGYIDSSELSAQVAVVTKIP